MAKGGRSFDTRRREVREMRQAETVLGINGMNDWRAGCWETRKSGSEGGRWKRSHMATSPAAYPTLQKLPKVLTLQSTADYPHLLGHLVVLP